jgi:hypothetical protein
MGARGDRRLVRCNTARTSQRAARRGSIVTCDASRWHSLRDGDGGKSEEVLAGASPAHRHMPACARRLWPNMRAAYRRMLYCTAASADVSCLGVADCSKQPQCARMLMQCRIQLPDASARILRCCPSFGVRSAAIGHRAWLRGSGRLLQLGYPASATVCGGASSARRLDEWRDVCHEPTVTVTRGDKINWMTACNGVMGSSTGVLVGESYLPVARWHVDAPRHPTFLHGTISSRSSAQHIITIDTTCRAVLRHHKSSALPNHRSR